MKIKSLVGLINVLLPVHPRTFLPHKAIVTHVKEIRQKMMQNSNNFQVGNKKRRKLMSKQ